MEEINLIFNFCIEIINLILCMDNDAGGINNDDFYKGIKLALLIIIGFETYKLCWRIWSWIGGGDDKKEKEKEKEKEKK